MMSNKDTYTWKTKYDLIKEDMVYNERNDTWKFKMNAHINSGEIQVKKVTKKILYTLKVKQEDFIFPNINILEYTWKNDKIIISSSIEYEDVFFPVIESIDNEIIINDKYSDREKLNIIDSKLRMWKACFMGINRNDMSKIEEIGLIGELVMLKKLIDHLGDDAIQYWTGAEYDKHDFKIGNIMIETKTKVLKDDYFNKYGYIHINGEDQLLDSQDIFLNINTLKEDISGYSLTDLVISIEKKINNCKYKDLFVDKLSRRKYSPTYISRVKYIIDDMAFYEVKEDFPRYKKIEGTIDLEYNLEIDYIEKYRCINGILDCLKNTTL